MNPFDRIREYRAALLLQIKDTMVKPNDTLTYKEHYQVLLNLLKMIEEDLHSAEYDYVIQKVGKQAGDTEYHVLKDMTLQATKLGENLLLFQPLFADEHDIGVADMESLIQALEALKEHDKISEEILIIPPGINVLKAKLSDPNQTDECTEEEEEKERTTNWRFFDTMDNTNIDTIGSPSDDIKTSDYDDLPF